MGETTGRSLHPAYYSDVEVKAILEAALGLDGTEFSRADLVTMAEQLGISEAQLQTAENTYFERVIEREQKEAFMAERRKKVLQVGAGYIVLCLIAYFAFLSGFGIFPAIAIVAFFPLLFTGIYLLSQVVNAIFVTAGDDVENAFDTWLQKRAERQRKQFHSQ